MGGLVWQQLCYTPNSPKSKASDWSVSQEANVNNNNSLVTPIRRLLFGIKIG